MKKANITVTFDADKLSAAQMYMEQKDLSFEDEMEKAAESLYSKYSGRLRNPSLGMAAVRLLSQLGRMFTDRLRRNEDGQRAVIEKKLRQKIEEKKQAHGMKMG